MDIPLDELENLAVETGISLITLQDWSRTGFLRKLEGPKIHDGHEELDRQVIID